VQEGSTVSEADLVLAYLRETLHASQYESSGLGLLPHSHDWRTMD
jgi:hypothetical protein